MNFDSFCDSLFQLDCCHLQSHLSCSSLVIQIHQNMELIKAKYTPQAILIQSLARNGDIAQSSFISRAVMSCFSSPINAVSNGILIQFVNFHHEIICTLFFIGFLCRRISTDSVAQQTYRPAVTYFISKESVIQIQL